MPFKSASRSPGCKYYQWCCGCISCRQRAEYEKAIRMAKKIPTLDTAPKRCECLKQIKNDGSCLSCGKSIVDAKSLRFAA